MARFPSAIHAESVDSLLRHRYPAENNFREAPLAEPYGRVHAARCMAVTDSCAMPRVGRVPMYLSAAADVLHGVDVVAAE